MELGNKTLFLVILNSIIGGGIFVNLADFNNNLGSWGFFSYLLGYALFFPIIFCIGSLARKQQVEGGLFLLAQKQLGVTFGFLTCWAYFLGRAVSVALLAQFLALGLKSNFAIAAVSDLGIAATLIFGIACLNIAGLSNTGVTQKVFTLLKLLPIFVLSGLAFLTTSFKTFELTNDWPMLVANFNSSFPSAVYALQGFTIVIHVGHLIKQPQRLLAVLLAATATAGAMCALFQAVVFGAVGKLVTSNLLVAFISKLGLGEGVLSFFIKNIVNIAIGSSCFMILTGNCWNLFALAKNDFLPGKQWLIAKVNAVPPLCLILHAFLSVGFLLICRNIPALQAASVFSTFCTYFLCSVAACRNFWHENKYYLSVGIAALCGCSYILWSSAKLVQAAGFSYEFLFLYLLGLGFIFRKNWFNITAEGLSNS